MNFRVLPAANGEVTEALAWYVRRFQFRAVARLWAMWLDGQNRIAANPRMYPLAEDNPSAFEIRNYILPRYGYRIVYQLHANEIVVSSFSRGQRRSAHWLARVESP